MQPQLGILVSALRGPFGAVVAYTDTEKNLVYFRDRRAARQQSGELCICKIFKAADELFKRMSPWEREQWELAVKVRDISAYQFFLKSTIYLWNQGLYAPNAPAIDGGFDYRKSIPGNKYPPPPCVFQKQKGLFEGRVRLQLTPYPPENVYWQYDHDLKDPVTGLPCAVTVKLAFPLDESLNFPDHVRTFSAPGLYSNYGNHFIVTPSDTWDYVGKISITRQHLTQEIQTTNNDWQDIGVAADTETPAELSTTVNAILMQDKPPNWRPEWGDTAGFCWWKPLKTWQVGDTQHLRIGIHIEVANLKTKRRAAGDLHVRGFWEDVQFKFLLNAKCHVPRDHQKVYTISSWNPVSHTIQFAHVLHGNKHVFKLPARKVFSWTDDPGGFTPFNTKLQRLWPW